MFIYLSVYIYIYICVCVCVCECINSPTCPWLCACTCVCVCVRMCVCVCVCVYTPVCVGVRESQWEIPLFIQSRKIRRKQHKIYGISDGTCKSLKHDKTRVFCVRFHRLKTRYSNQDVFNVRVLLWLYSNTVLTRIGVLNLFILICSVDGFVSICLSVCMSVRLSVCLSARS